MTELDTELAVKRALTALALAGFPPEFCVVGVTCPVVEGEDTPYEVHIGATGDYREAEMLNFMAEAIKGVTNQQAMALYGPEHCPACDSPRYGLEQRPDGPMRIRTLGICMDCGFEHPWPKDGR